MKRRCTFVVLGLVFALSGCTTPDSVSEFCASATSTLDAGGPVFADMKQSCLREVASRAEFGAFTPPSQDDTNCAAIGEKAVGAQAALSIVSDYYDALNDLVSFGTTKAGTDAQTLVSQAGAAVGAGSSTQTALGSLAKMIVSAASGRYQQKQIEKDLASASGSITQVNDALIKILQEDYIGRQLGSEEEKLSIRYREFAKLHPSPEVTLVLDDRWHSDERALQARRASAKSLIAALNTLSKGTADLAANAPHLKAKESVALLEPYVVRLRSLLPLIQRGF
jgi:hypothetical protein